jgi:hypothetical protein
MMRFSSPVKNKSSTYNNNITWLIVHNLEVEVRIRFTLGKAQARQKTIYPAIPSSRSLLQSIQSLLQLADMRLLVFNFKSLRFLYIYTSSLMTPFRKGMFTSIWCNFHFILAARDMMALIEVYLATRSECLFIVNAFFLRKSMSEKSWFMLLNTSIRSMFYFDEPFGRYHILALQSDNYSHT